MKRTLRLPFVLIMAVTALITVACGPTAAPTPETVVVTATSLPPTEVPPEPETIVVTATPDPAAEQPAEEAPDEEAAPPEEEAPAEETPAAAGDVPRATSNAAWDPVVERFNATDFMLVPPGCFQMGFRDGFTEETPQHEQCFDEPFYIARTETTNEQYGSDGSFSGENFPRNDVTWYEARAFCQGIGGSLPTEAQWEYAARGPSNWTYPFGDTFQPGFVIHADNAAGATEVGSQPNGASWVGAVDMLGNLREWTSTGWEPYPYYDDDEREQDPSGDFPRRVVRGGSFQSGSSNLRASFREFYNPDDDTGELGFRCVLPYGG